MTPADRQDQPTALNVGDASDVGRIREANEDSLLRDDDARLFVVADGMGGHRAGEVASTTAVQALREHLADGHDLSVAVEAANASVFGKSRDDPDMRGMGTTLTAMRIEEGTAFIGHVGDSRAYLLRDGQLTQVTEDHSLVEELVREGRLTPEEAAVHPQRSVITRAIGVDEDVDVATYEIELRDDDRVLLCSDGLTSMIRDDAIRSILETESDPQVAADRLVTAANEAGGEDNITVLIVDVAGDPAAERERALAASEAAPGDAGEPTGEWEQLPAELGTDDGEPDVEKPAARRRWRQVAVYLVPALVIVVLAVAALAWYARSNYFVGLDRSERVTLFQGIPDGFLVWDPTVAVRTSLEADELTEAELDEVRNEKQFSTRGGAEAFVGRLRDDVEARAAATTTTTTTTQPGATTTTGSA